MLVPCAGCWRGEDGTCCLVDSNLCCMLHLWLCEWTGVQWCEVSQMFFFFQFLQVYATSQCYCKKISLKQTVAPICSLMPCARNWWKKMLIQHLNTSKVQMLRRLLAGGKGRIDQCKIWTLQLINRHHVVHFAHWLSAVSTGWCLCQLAMVTCPKYLPWFTRLVIPLCLPSFSW